jgi:hypothetical protein
LVTNTEIFSFLSKELKTTLLTLMFLWGRIKARFSSWNFTLLRLQRQGRSRRALMRAKEDENACSTWNISVFLVFKSK